jgi:multidrug efflux pump subunit AcrA (membrane-fusion protein)
VLEGKDDISSNMQDAKIYIDKAESSKTKEDIDSAISRTISALNNTYNDLKIARDQCDQGIYYTNVSSTDKASVDTQISYINTAITSTTSSQQSISSYKIALQKANDNLNFKIANPRSEDVDIYKSQIEQAEANVSLYQSQLNDNYIYSPIDGRITDINVKKGETVSPSESIIDLLSIEPFQIKVDIYEQDIINVNSGNLVKINLVAFPKETFEGKVLTIDPAEKIVDNVVYYQVTIEFPNQPKGVRSGMTADIVIETNKKDDVLRISKNAVEVIDNKSIVQVVTNNKKIENREVTLGLEGSDYYEITSGLNEGDLIIVGSK